MGRGPGVPCLPSQPGSFLWAGLQGEPRTLSPVGFSVLVALAELGAACLGVRVMIKADRIKEASARLRLHPYGAFQPALLPAARPGSFLGALLKIP